MADSAPPSRQRQRQRSPKSKSKSKATANSKTNTKSAPSIAPEIQRGLDKLMAPLVKHTLYTQPRYPRENLLTLLDAPDGPAKAVGPKLRKSPKSRVRSKFLAYRDHEVRVFVGCWFLSDGCLGFVVLCKCWIDVDFETDSVVDGSS